LDNGSCDVYEEQLGQPDVPALSSLRLVNLKSYGTRFSTTKDRPLLHSRLFPHTLEPNLPSLSCLNLRGIHPATVSIAIHLAQAVSHSLRYLQLSFRYLEDGTLNTSYKNDC
jgi:hypothetical protein